MTEFYKFDLLKRLDEIYEVHLLSLASYALLSSDQGLKELETIWMGHYGKTWHLKDMSESLREKNNKVHKTRNFSNASKKFFITEPVNIVKEYCEVNNIDNLKEEKWFDFASVIRNYLIHGHLDYKRYKKIKFPIEWNGNIITDQEVKESEIKVYNFANSYPLDLFNVIKSYAQSLPEN